VTLEPSASVPLGVTTPATVLSVAVVGKEGVATARAVFSLGGAVIAVNFVTGHLGLLRFGFGLALVCADFVSLEHVLLFDVARVVG